MAANPTPKKKGAVAAARKTQKQPPWLWIGTAVVVLALAVAAIVAGGGDDGGSETAGGVEQNRPVEVSGSKLPEFDSEVAQDPAIGTPAPEVRGQSFDGSPVAITNDGRAKLVLFVAHWCPHCRNEVPLLADWLKSNQLPNGVDLYTVSTGVSSKSPNYPPSRWLEKEGWTAPTLADSEDQEVAEAFGLGSYPYFVAIDGSGRVAARTSGEIGTGEFVALAERALGGQ